MIDHQQARSITSLGADETRRVGFDLGGQLHFGDLVLLRGSLGSGKTTLTQGIAAALGVQAEVQSPTFTLVAQYPIEVQDSEGWLIHADLHRLEGELDLDSIGIAELLDADDSIVVIEWSERLGQTELPPHWTVTIEFALNDGRLISISPPIR